MSDKRRRGRSTTNIAGRLTSDQLDLPCTILDMSETGARLQIEPGVFLPKLFVLRAPEAGGDLEVDVVWRNRTQLGVRF